MTETPLLHRDIRESDIYREIRSLAARHRAPGSGVISDASDLSLSADRTRALFSSVIVDTLDATPSTRICEMDLRTGATRVLTGGPHSDRSARYAPDGSAIAFLSDSQQQGVFQLCLLERDGPARATVAISGSIEYLHWSPDGRHILLAVAALGVELAGAQGAVQTTMSSDGAPEWAPTVEQAEAPKLWRRLWLYQVSDGTLELVSPKWLNCWEAVWCGNDAIAAIASDNPREGAWYGAFLALIACSRRQARVLYRSQFQLAGLASSPSGQQVAVIEAFASDRAVVAGEVKVINAESGDVESVDAAEADITQIHWLTPQKLLLAGHRGFDTLVATSDITNGMLNEIWISGDRSTEGIYAQIAPLNDSGDFVVISEDFLSGPEIAIIYSGAYRTVASFAQAPMALCAQVQGLSWNGEGDESINGWLIVPEGSHPHPTLTYLHGGPVWHWHPRWLGRANFHALALLDRGFALFFPNPRGSSGRGRHFATAVIGDPGGVDAGDILKGLDHLIAAGIADKDRLGVTGVSYGGFLSAWLITQDRRFAAAAPVSPVTNHLTTRLLSNVPQFTDILLRDVYTDRAGKYLDRSPVMHAKSVTTPTLNICGALDRCTPPEEARQFHAALTDAGAPSVLLTYPREGHGVRGWPATFDYSARIVDWFDHYLRLKPKGKHD
jgi:dipeptidyl aminopeptidase/acylaminoacyl peptidase